MGFLDVLFGRNKPVKSRTEAVFALSTARLAIETELGMVSSNRCGICLKPVQSGDYQRAASEVKDLVTLAAKDTKSRLCFETDQYKYQWIIMEDEDFEDLVNLTHLVGLTLTENGYNDVLLSAVFKFRKPEVFQGQAQEAQELYIIYNYKRGKFYTFAPRQDSNASSRDNSAEIRASAVLERELPMEKDLTRWYPLWNCPV